MILDLEGNFQREAAANAAAIAALRAELKSLSGTSVNTSRDNDTLARSIKGAGSEVTRTGQAFERGGSQIDKYSGRLGLVLRTAAAFGPAIIPIGAAAIPAIAGLTAGLGAAAGAFGVTLLAVQGLGDGLKALDAYQLEPTAENLAALRLEMDKLGPSGAEFVRYLDDLEPQLHALQDVARQGLFPGVEDGIDALLTKLPQAKRIIFDIASALGDVASSAGKGLAGDGFRDFFNYLETDAAPTLKAFAEATGNVAAGIANLIVGVAPLSRDFTSGMVAATQSFQDWTASLAGTQGFQDFLSYVRETGPQVAELMGQLALSLASIVEAAAPVGQALLPALTGIAKAVGLIAQSDLGTPLFAGLAAMSALRLATQAWGKIAQTSIAGFVAGNARAAGSILTVVSAQERAMMSSRELAATQAATNRAALVGAGKMAAVFAGMALASGEFGDSVATSNASTMALMGTIAGPWGAAAGLAIGAFLDIKANAAQAGSAIDALHDAMLSGDELAFTNALDAINAQLERQTADTIYGTSVLGDHIGAMFNVIQPATNYQKLLGFLSGSTDDLAAASADAGAGMNFFGTQLRIAGSKSEAMAKHTERVQSALLASQQAAEETAGAFLAFGDSLDDSKVSLDDWIAEQQKVADALQNFAKNAADAARKGLDEGFIQKLKEAGPEGALRLAQLADASEKQIDRINRAFRTGARGAKALNDVLASLKNPTLDVNDAQMRAKINAAMASLRKYGLTRAQASMLIQDLASGKIKTVQQLVNKYGMSEGTAKALLNDLASPKLRAVQALLNSLHDKTITINTIHQDSYVSKLGGTADPNPDARGADGMTVPGQRLPYGDKILAYIAPGEEVISNRHGQADRNRDLLKAINANRFAGGGTVGGGNHVGPNSQLFGINQSWLSAAELGARLFGLTNKQIAALDKQFDHLGKHSLTKLSKAFDVATKSAEDEVAAEKARLSELRQAQSEMIDALKAKFDSQLFGNQAEGFQGQSSMVPVRQPDGSISWESVDYQNLSAEEQAAQYQSYQSSQPTAEDTLKGDTTRMKRLLSLIPLLKKMGIHGAALKELLQDGTLEEIEAYAFGSRAHARQYQSLYGQRAREERLLGRAGGNAVYGAAIKAQAKEVQESNAHLRELNKEMKSLKAHVAKLSNKNEGVHIDSESQRGIAQAAKGGGSATLRKGAPK